MDKKLTISVVGILLLLSGIWVLTRDNAWQALEDHEYVGLAVSKAKSRMVVVQDLRRIKKVIHYIGEHRLYDALNISQPSHVNFGARNGTVDDALSIEKIKRLAGLHRQPALSSGRLHADLQGLLPPNCPELTFAGQIVQFADNFGVAVSTSHREIIARESNTFWRIIDDFYQGAAGNCTNSFVAIIGGTLGLLTPVGNFATVTDIIRGKSTAGALKEGYTLFNTIPDDVLSNFGNELPKFRGTLGRVVTTYGIFDNLMTARRDAIDYAELNNRFSSIHHPGTVVKYPMYQRLTDLTRMGGNSKDVLSKLTTDIAWKVWNIHNAMKQDNISLDTLIDLASEDGIEATWILLHVGAEDGNLGNVLELRAFFRDIATKRGLPPDTAVPIVPFMEYTDIRSKQQLYEQGVTPVVALAGIVLILAGSVTLLIGIFTRRHFDKEKLRYPAIA